MSGLNKDNILAADDSIAISDGTNTLAIDGSGNIGVTDAGGSLTVDAVDLDIRDLTHVSDSVKVGDGTDFLEVNGDGSINAVVMATQLDIDDLVNTDDSVAIGDATTIVDMAVMDSSFGVTSAGFPIMGIRQDAGGSPVSATGDAHPLVFNSDGELKVAADLTSDIADDDVNSGNPIQIGGEARFGVLTALSTTADRYHLLADEFRRTFINDSPQIAGASVAVSVDTTVGGKPLPATSLNGRRRMIIQNRSTSQDVYIGPSGVTIASGLVVSKKSSLAIDIGDAVVLNGIVASSTADVRVFELA